MDAALGKGEQLTALARAARSNPHKDIAFRTDWDDLRPEPEHDADGPIGPVTSPADLVERNGVVSQPQADKQPADLLDGQGTPGQRQDRGHKPGPNHRPKV